MWTPAALAILAVLIFLLGSIGIGAAGGPVSRTRVEHFAHRQRLAITATNGDHVIRYLATARRWRAAGVVAGLLASVTASLPQSALRVDFVLLFAGWFLGALVAEFRMAHLVHQRRRVASLRPRRPSTYISRVRWALIPADLTVATVVAGGTAVAAATDRAHPSGTALLWLGVALFVGSVVRAVQLHVLRRPQPHGEPDVTAADDAIRSRSLHVLAGGGTALVLLCVLAQLGSVRPLDPDIARSIEVGRNVAAFAVAVLGWAAATWPMSGPEAAARRRPAEAT